MMAAVVFVLLPIVSMSNNVVTASGATMAARPYAFGTLQTAAATAPAESSVGVKVAELTVGWDLYEPQEGVFNTAYAAQMKQQLQAFQAAGMQVVLGLALHYPPAWVFSYPNSRYVDQFGGTTDEVNLVFNQTLREKAQAFIARVNEDLGLNSFWAVRITSGGDAEVLFPAETADGTHGNDYWAYDANAQGGVDRPGTIPAPPLPGWRPGATTCNGQPVAVAQVQQWYDWYVGALVDSVNWQIQTYRSLGYSGFLQILTPGLGVRPSDYANSTNAYLNGEGDSNDTMGRGAAWYMVYPAIADRTNVVAYISSIADGSGENDVCQASDQSVSLNDPVVNNWSAVRWISYLADKYGLPKNGENPDAGVAGYGTAMMQAAVRQMQACGLQGMIWAFDSNLWNNTADTSLASYVAVINQYQ